MLVPLQFLCQPRDFLLVSIHRRLREHYHLGTLLTLDGAATRVDHVGVGDLREEQRRRLDLALGSQHQATGVDHQVAVVVREWQRGVNVYTVQRSPDEAVARIGTEDRIISHLEGPMVPVGNQTEQ